MDLFMRENIRVGGGLRFSCIFLACVLLFSGCGGVKLPEVIETTTISVDSQGGITSYLVEDFEKGYYDVSELEAMAAEDAAAFNQEHQSGETVPLTLEKVELQEDTDQVLVQHSYLNRETFEEYNHRELFFGTVEEALEDGYDLSAILTSVKNREALSYEELMEKPQKSHVLVTDAKAVFYCPYRVTHVGDGVVCREDGSVDTSLVEGTVVVLMKR